MGSSPSEAMMITEEQRADTTPCKSALENEQGDDMNRSRLEEGAFGEEEMEVVRPPSRSVSSVRAKMDSPSDLVSAIGKRHADDLAPASMASYADAFNAPTARLTAKDLPHRLGFWYHQDPQTHTTFWMTERKMNSQAAHHHFLQHPRYV
jgi:hypothetical protein